MTPYSAPIVVSNTPMLKALLVVGVAGFAAGALLGVGGAIHALLHPAGEAPPLVVAALWLGFGVFFGWLALAGRPLLRFLGLRLELGETEVRLVGRDRATVHRWDALRFRVHPTLQVVEIFDRDGNRIYAVDFMAHNARVLLQRIDAGPPDED
jgi:hypothetical protein